ncbi:MAG: DUF4442 domain-containing protein [Xanthomonadales bacterium]|nr:DUF4442 domain-containing protein [Xanthomonadales bacterium]
MKASTLRRLMNIWSPFRSPGIRVTHWSDDWREVRVELRQRRFNMNFVGTHYGGSLFSMTDPFWMLILLHVLGGDYLVWDKRAEIDFVKPGKGTVHAEFRLEQAVLDEIIAATASGEKYLRWLPVEVIDEQGEAVARVRKQIYVRRKPDRPMLEPVAHTA